MRVLGIETSCDETGIAIYDSNQGLLGHTVYSQSVHVAFGGVVPELASRDHVKKILPLIEAALQNANLTIKELDGIAYTVGPGLAGALLVGVMLGRALAFALNIPAIGIHHLEGHLLAAFLEPNPPSFPFLALLVSGGHTELVQVHQVGEYEIIGDTLDDAVGEAFDKIGKLLGLPYPAGALLAKMAEQGRPNRYTFPRPMLDRAGLDFSFSGLKTKVAQTIAAASPLDEQTKADIAHAFEVAIVETLTTKCKRALQSTKASRLVVAGGVGANQSLRQSLQILCKQTGVNLYFPRPIFCTDNGAMIAYAGCRRLLAGEKSDLSVNVYPRYPLSECKRLPI